MCNFVARMDRSEDRLRCLAYDELSVACSRRDAVASAEEGMRDVRWWMVQTLALVGVGDVLAYAASGRLFADGISWVVERGWPALVEMRAALFWYLARWWLNVTSSGSEGDVETD